MFLAKVIGKVVLSHSDIQMPKHRLLIIQPIDENGKENDVPQVSMDIVGAGAGETVLVTTGDESMLGFLPEQPPGDLCIIGIVDSLGRE